MPTVREELNACSRFEMLLIFHIQQYMLLHYDWTELKKYIHHNFGVKNEWLYSLN